VWLCVGCPGRAGLWLLWSASRLARNPGGGACSLPGSGHQQCFPSVPASLHLQFGHSAISLFMIWVNGWLPTPLRNPDHGKPDYRVTGTAALADRKERAALGASVTGSAAREFACLTSAGTRPGPHNPPVTPAQLPAPADRDEDRCQVRTASGPRVMVSLRNLAISILRLSGATGIAAALRNHARQPSRSLQTITRCQPASPHPGSGRAAERPWQRSNPALLSVGGWPSPG
jgi:hypothetical protein